MAASTTTASPDRPGNAEEEPLEKLEGASRKAGRSVWKMQLHGCRYSQGRGGSRPVLHFWHHRKEKIVIEGENRDQRKKPR